MRSGVCIARKRQAHPISGRGSSYSRGQYPTPAATQYGTNQGGRHLDGPVRPSLETWARHWPTPTAGDAKGSGQRSVETNNANDGVSLTDAAVRPWATPGANDWKGSTKPGQRRGQLDEQVTHRHPTMPRDGESGPGDMVLDPRFVASLMNLPALWCVTESTCSECSGTHASRAKLKTPFESCGKGADCE
jgi:hypothetical protein